MQACDLYDFGKLVLVFSILSCQGSIQTGVYQDPEQYAPRNPWPRLAECSSSVLTRQEPPTPEVHPFEHCNLYTQLQLLASACLLVSWKVREHSKITAQKIVKYTNYNVQKDELLISSLFKLIWGTRIIKEQLSAHLTDICRI